MSEQDEDLELEYSDYQNIMEVFDGMNEYLFDIRVHDVDVTHALFHRRGEIKRVRDKIERIMYKKYGGRR